MSQSNSQNAGGVNGNGHATSNVESPNRGAYRRSLDMKFYEGSQDQLTSPVKQQIPATPPKLQSSYSANDVPTMKTTSNTNSAPLNPTSNSHAQQHFHNHNASLGRIPPNATINNRMSRDLSAESPGRETQNGATYPSITSALQASAAPFGPPMTQTAAQAQSPSSVLSPGLSAYPQQAYNYGYGMQMLQNGMQNMSMGQQQIYSPNNPYANYGTLYQPNNGGTNGGARDSQARVIAQRRQNDGEGIMLSKHLSMVK